MSECLKQDKIISALDNEQYAKFVKKSFKLVDLVPLVGNDEDDDSTDKLLMTSIYLMRIKHLLSNRFPLEAPIPPNWNINAMLPSVIKELKKYNKKNMVIFRILCSGQSNVNVPLDLLNEIIECNNIGSIPTEQMMSLF